MGKLRLSITLDFAFSHLTVEVAHFLLSSFRSSEPGHPVTSELLDTRRELRLMQVEIVYRADAKDALAGEAC